MTKLIVSIITGVLIAAAVPTAAHAANPTVSANTCKSSDSKVLSLWTKNSKASVDYVSAYATKIKKKNLCLIVGSSNTSSSTSENFTFTNAKNPKLLIKTKQQSSSTTKMYNYKSTATLTSAGKKLLGIQKYTYSLKNTFANNTSVEKSVVQTTKRQKAQLTQKTKWNSNQNSAKITTEYLETNKKGTTSYRAKTSVNRKASQVGDSWRSNFTGSIRIAKNGKKFAAAKKVNLNFSSDGKLLSGTGNSTYKQVNKRVSAKITPFTYAEFLPTRSGSGG